MAEGEFGMDWRSGIGVVGVVVDVVVVHSHVVLWRISTSQSARVDLDEQQIQQDMQLTAIQASSRDHTLCYFPLDSLHTPVQSAPSCSPHLTWTLCCFQCCDSSWLWKQAGLTTRSGRAGGERAGERQRGDGE